VTDYRERPVKGQVDCGQSLARQQGIALSLVILGAVCAGPVSAEVKYDIGATSQYQYNTNVFDLPAGYGLLGPGNNQRADAFVTYGAQGNVDYLVSDQDFFFRGTVTDFRYQHFTELTHYEYNGDAGWNFKLGTEWDGTLEVLRNRTMVQFYDLNQTGVLNQTNLSLQTEQREKGNIRFHFLPDWRVGVTAYTSQITEPTVESPNLKLDQSSGAAELEYLGVSNLSAGVTTTYLSGRYSGNTGFDSQFDTNFSEVDEALVATYKLTGVSTLNAEAGYSDRTSADSQDNLSGFTGSLGLKEQLTGKTALNLRVSRVIQSYIANVGSEIDSIGHIDVTWQATYKTGFTAAYEYTYRDLPGQGNDGDTRIDHNEYASIGIDYEPTRFISIKPYANFTTRHSNVSLYEYSGNIYGVNVLIHMRDY
jgi:Putative beta-barrel porin 2